MRAELGGYLWVQEFQKRGVIHYHVLCEREVEESRVRFLWTQAIGALSDAAALRHGVKVARIRDHTRVRGYLGKYVGKPGQKKLPPGVEKAGRWWGRSRSLKLDLVAEVVSCEKENTEGKRAESRVVRCVRKFVAGVLRARIVGDLARTVDAGERKKLKARLRRPFKGGWFVNWGGELSASLVGMIGRLREFYGVTGEVPASVAEFTWATDEWVDEDGRVHEIRPAV